MTILTVALAQHLERLGVSRTTAISLVVSVERSLLIAEPGGAAHGQLLHALSDAESLVGHLERAIRLTDPAAADPLVARADEPRRSIGS